MARRSQCSSAGDNPLDPNYLPPHYREEYRLAIDALVEEDLEGYYHFLQKADVVDFLSLPEIQYIQDSVQVPQQTNYPEQRFLDTGVDGSSDTYWPVLSDLDAPGLDLGWPQLHFFGPAEVTTLVNPPEPDMPSIKEQARRLIKNAQQVIAIVMDMFTDVDMFADILNAAMRNVPVYILLDKKNIHHFVNMVSNCRVNLQNIQFLRVRTVSGITYHCRSGKSFQGQMIDRFLLTDCRAVLSGNYSFMWSFEKLHRCMAHLFLGQLVSTFDEEFRILYAQSEPLVIENVVPPMEDFSRVQKRQYPSERTSLYREPKKFLSLDTPHPEEWGRHSHDERADMDWRLMPLKRQESLHGPADMYGRIPPQQSRMDPSFDQGSSRIPMMENPAFKRHSYAEGIHGRYSYPFLQQQGMPEPENQGRQFHRGQHPYPGPGPVPGKEADYTGYDKFWNQDFHSADQYSDSGLPQEMEPPDNFDPVLNYLSSTRNVDFDQGSEKLPPDLPFSSSQPRRLSLGQPYVYQISPTPSKSSDQKQIFPESNTDRKDPVVKRGLRDWRISSYLSACDSPADEGLPLAPPHASDPFEEPSNPVHQTTRGIDLSVPKIPNVREFKVPAIPRASQMPSYVKTTVREPKEPKKTPDEPTAVAAETKTTPSPSESSSTTEGEKTEVTEQKEPKTTIQREDSFRRKYNAAIPRSSRLRSSLIFSSLEQQNPSQDTKTAPGQQDDESDKNEAEQTKLPFGLGPRRSAREPFEWSRYIKSATVDNSATDPSKPEDGNSKTDDKDSSKEENSKDLLENPEVKESLTTPDVEQANSSPSLPQSFEAELPKTEQPVQPPKSLLTAPAYVDMSDPDKRLMFFKELAAKRKAAKAAEAEKSKEKAPMKPPTTQKNSTTIKKEESIPKQTAENMDNTTTSEGLSEKNAVAEEAGKTASTKTCKAVGSSLDSSDKVNKEDSQVNDPSASQSCKEVQTRVSADSAKIELKNNQSATILPVFTDTEASQSESPGELKLSDPLVKSSSHSHPSTPTNVSTDNIPSLAQRTDDSESPYLDSTSNKSNSFSPCSIEGPPSAVAILDSNCQNPKLDQLETSTPSPLLVSEKSAGSECNSSNPSVQSSSLDHILPDSDSQISPGLSPSTSAPLSTPVGTISSSETPDDLKSTQSSMLSSNTQESVSPSPTEPFPSVEETSQKSTTSSISQTDYESTQASQLTFETPTAVDAAHVESDIPSDSCAASSAPDTSPLEASTKTDLEESCDPPPEKDVPESQNKLKTVGEEFEVHQTSVDVKADSPAPSSSPLSPESCLLNTSGLESSDQNEIIAPTPSSEDALSVQSPAEKVSPVPPDYTPNISQSETTACPQDDPIQATPPFQLNLTRPVILTSADTDLCSSSLPESVELVLSPEAVKTSTLHSSNSSPEQVTTDSDETPELPLSETSCPPEPTSKVPMESDLPCKTSESLMSETHLSEPPVPAESNKIDNQNEVIKEIPEKPDPGEKERDDTDSTNEVNKSTKESVCSDETNDQVRQNKCSDPPEITPDEVVPPSPQPKQQKSSQSRYQSSTANVLSSSNLRDDTKLLLEQISANSQNRNEATKESPVTDDEKEDEADKNAKREKERGIRSLSRVPPKSEQEREKLLEKIQSMRKERKVYSRFEMAP